MEQLLTIYVPLFCTSKCYLDLSFGMILGLSPHLFCTSLELSLKGLDLDKNAIQRIESGDRFVTDIELKVFAAFFGVSTDELLRTDSEVSPETTDIPIEYD